LLQSKILLLLPFMLKSLKIENFRGFESFELAQLGRINLIVGENNSGKTSVLEAIQLLSTRANLEPLAQTMFDRGESFRAESRRGISPGRDRELDVRQLFYGHEIALDSSFSITSISDLAEEALFGRVEEVEQQSLFESSDDRDTELILRWSFNGELEELKCPLSSDGGIPSDYSRRLRPRSFKSLPVTMQFVTSASVPISKMVELFNHVVLTPEEDNVVQALQSIDPMIERIASLGDRYPSSQSRGSFALKRRDELLPVPIGSMGDGIWRILGLVLAVVGSKGGILLVDEIDTGLHFTAMLDMWKMIWATSKRLNVQVFVTTHSRDCWESLAEVAESEGIQDDEIMVHRIEKGKKSSVTFNSPQMTIAAERGIEVR
jgi:predicted ATP-dependent endonuclease of OLD family